MVFMGGSVAEWSLHRTRNPAGLGFESRSGDLLLFSVIPTQILGHACI